MNAQLTSEIRELTDLELDAVSGGLNTEMDHPNYGQLCALGLTLGSIGLLIMGIIEDIFG
jgi:hypothetical protein